MNVPKEKFDSLADSEALSEPKKAVEAYKALVFAETKEEFPQNPKYQLIKAVSAAFDSWSGEEKITRKKNKILLI